MLNIFKKSTQLVEFFSTVEGLTSLQEIHPAPAHKFVPTWWKNLPKQEPYPAIQTVKMCPSFPDIFSQGYVVPLWADLYIKYDRKNGQYEWRIGRPGTDNPFSLESHPDVQFLDHVEAHTNGTPVSFVFKLVCPWKLKTPKGYSVFQLPMTYHYDNNFSTLPGIIHTDTHHTINQQLAYHGSKDEILIKRGTPIAQYIPFERKKYDLEVREMNKEDLLSKQEMFYRFMTKFEGSGVYNEKHRKNANSTAKK